MKTERFFYRFGQWRDAWSATNPFIKDEEDPIDIGETFNGIKAEWEEFLSVLWGMKEEFESDFSARKNRKLSRIEEWIFWEETAKIRQIVDRRTSFIEIWFSKPISETSLRVIEDFCGFPVIKLSSFDTVLHLRVQDWEHTIFPWLERLSSTQIATLWESLSGLSRGKLPTTSALANIRFVHSDRAQKLRLESFSENAISDPSERVTMTLSPDSVNSGDFTILNQLADRYTTPESRVFWAGKILERARKGESINLTFQGFSKEFFGDVALLVDWLQDLGKLEPTKWCESTQEITYRAVETLWTESENLPIISILDRYIAIDPVFLHANVASNADATFNPEPKDWTDSHWIEVASLAVYWESVLGTSLTPRAKVLWLTGTFMWTAEKVISAALAWNSKIINCSQGITAVLRDNHEYISEFAVEIDQALTNKDVLWIQSAWNIKNPRPSSYHEFTGWETNINPPKDSISTISVGSHNQEKSAISLFSRKDNTEPNVMIGGQAWIMLRLRDKVKPEFLAHGEQTPVFNWTRWTADSGTSYAAPKLAHQAARILSDHPNATSDTLKCFLLNYTKLDEQNKTFISWIRHSYSNPDIARRHFGFGVFNFGEFERDGAYLDIVIQDFIKTNQKKHYPIRLPPIGRNESIKIVRSIAYNPPVSWKFHLKYCRFCVSGRIWSNFFQGKQDTIFNSTRTEEEKWEEWNEVKSRSKSLKWINYFGPNQRWHPLCMREEELLYDEYQRVNDNMVVVIEWHWEPNFTQRFSHTITIRLDKIQSPEHYLRQFAELNSTLVIRGDELSELFNEKLLLNEAFERIQNPVHTILESLSDSN